MIHKPTNNFKQDKDALLYVNPYESIILQPWCEWLGSGRANWAVSGFHHPGILELFSPSATNCAISVDSNQQKAWTHCQGCWCPPCRLIVTFRGLGNPRPAMWQRSHCSFTRNGSPSTQALSSVAWAMAHRATKNTLAATCCLWLFLFAVGMSCFDCLCNKLLEVRA